MLRMFFSIKISRFCSLPELNAHTWLGLCYHCSIHILISFPSTLYNGMYIRQVTNCLLEKLHFYKFALEIRKNCRYEIYQSCISQMTSKLSTFSIIISLKLLELIMLENAWLKNKMKLRNLMSRLSPLLDLAWN